MQNQTLSRRAREILYNFRKELNERSLDLKQLVVMLFQFEKEKFRRSQFSTLIKEVDSRLTHQDIDRIWAQLDSSANGFIFLTELLANLNSITEHDNPFRNQLGKQSLIIEGNRVPPQELDEKGQIILALKQFKDMLKNSDPWQLLEVFDQDRDGMLTKEEMASILRNFEMATSKISLFVAGVFGKKKKCSFAEILNALGLQDVGKKVNSSEIKHRDSLMDQSRLANPIRVPGADMQIQQYPIEKQKSTEETTAQKIPEAIEPYFNYSSQMTQPLLSTAMSYLMANQVFIDQDNPHSALAHRWQHITFIFKSGYYLFQNRESRLGIDKRRRGLGSLMDANNIIQGGVGDCYLMSAIAGIVEHYPELIYRLFVLEMNPASIYGVRLFVDGAWETIITDARFPVNYHEYFVYAKPNKHEIWVLLLEKAWAKLYKSYENISSGYSSEGLTAITGAPCINMNTKQEGTLEKTQIYLKKGYIINCSGSQLLGQMTPAEQQQMGIFHSHAYTVIAIHPDLNWKGRKITLIKVRNPWGSKAWKGDWSFNSETWTNQLKTQLGYSRDPQDGTFYMSIQDFMTYYNELTVCFVSLGKVNSHISLTSDRQHSVMVAFSVRRGGQYFFSLYQESRRKYRTSGNYQLSKSRMFLGRVVGNTTQAVSSKACVRQNLHLQATLEPGDYIISCKIKWIHKDRNTFNLTSYGPEQITFKEVPEDKNFIHQFITCRAELQLDQKLYYQNNHLATSYKMIGAYPKQGYGYIFVRNNSPHMLETQIKLHNVRGLKALKPDTFPYHLFVPPHSHVVRPLLVDPQGFAYHVSQNFNLH